MRYNTKVCTPDGTRVTAKARSLPTGEWELTLPDGSITIVYRKPKEEPKEEEKPSDQ